MSRNSDKANTVLFRFQEQQAEKGGYKDYNSLRRPNPFKTNSIKDLQGFRKVITHELNDKVNRINNESLGLSEFQILELNNDINELLKERWNFDKQLQKISGGGGYQIGKDIILANSLKINGIRYFGLAKNLDNIVKLKKEIDLLKSQKLDEIKQQQDKELFIKNLTQRVNSNYYGIDNDYDNEDNDNEDKELQTIINERTRTLLKQTNPNLNLNDKPLIDKINYTEDIEKVLVERRKQQLQSLYNI
ncbi:hypothetical protein WICMUC_005877 [Wickerhamomyces mucosus]|uniref:Pre-mRNA-splicing factor ISY1 n=1 Tax=Wickerhamomyces mucosus TaxID=1378264 RepID=A0A9P8P171_9ASCO|nr:hypothetical protein WICMUC_005877 [Wickerhamomyces mucosus]